MSAENKDARVQGGRRKKQPRNSNAAILAQAAGVAAELERIRTDPTIGPLRRQAALETLERVRRS